MIYRGNVPSAVNKDAKYAVIYGGYGRMEIRLLYRLEQGEKALITTSAHPELVETVNAAKIEHNGSPGGAFYINEYGHVLVPAGNECYLAGTYNRFLEFEFEGSRIGPKAPEGLAPGDIWKGPRVGIAYTLCANGIDIKYKAQVRPNVFKEVLLSEDVGAAAAARLTRRFSRHKPGGGRIYINEAREFFAPAQRGGFWVQIYLGSLAEDDWFAPPPII